VDRIALEQSLAAASNFRTLLLGARQNEGSKVSNTMSAILCGLDDLECKVQVGTGRRNDEDDPCGRGYGGHADSNFFGSRLSWRVCESEA